MKSKIWKSIKKIKYNNTTSCLNSLKKRGYKISPWIENIFKKKKIDYKNFIYPIKLYKIKVSELGINAPVELNKIYKKILLNKFKLVDPSIALYARAIYDEQLKGEWLRFATPLDSMIDDDGVPHLPKIGRALGFYFIETYWSYPKAIFHPHNEFVFMI
jgi:hypothetical protein